MNNSFKVLMLCGLAATVSACASGGAPVYRTQAITDSSALNNTGFAYMQSKDYMAAKPYFVRALEIEPNLAAAHLNLGTVYQNTGSPSMAIDQFNLAIANDTRANDYPAITRTTEGPVESVTQVANRNLEKIRVSRLSPN